MTARGPAASGVVAVSRATVRTVRALAGVAGAVVRSVGEPEVAARVDVRAAVDVTAPIPLRGRAAAGAAPAGAPLGPGTVVGGRYVVLELLARGGMSDVFRVRDTRSGGLGALKALRGSDAVAAHRLDTEVRLLRRLSHRNLLRLHDVGCHDGRPYLALELADGGTLASLLLAGPLDPGRVVSVGTALADALRYVHDHGVVHRDVTPANVLLDSGGRPLLGDFGIARTTETTAVTGSGLVIGTVSYLAPELLDGATPTAAADVYSLGLVLLECLTGRREFTGTPAEVALAKAGRGPDVPATLEPTWRALLPAMTDRDPGRRPTARDVHDVLARLSSRAPLNGCARG